MISKRYKDLFLQYIHKGEPTPLSIGTLVILGLCFLFLIIATFTQFSFSHPWFKFISGHGFVGFTKNVVYNPLIPTMIFIIYILRKSYSILLFIIYICIGFFVWPIFLYGGGIEYIQNYLFGYVLGFFFAILIAGYILQISQNIKFRIIAALAGVLTIHLTELIYCIILAIFKIINFSLVIPIINVINMGNILYDILFSLILILIAPYIKNIFWICMKPKNEAKKKSKNVRKRS